MKISLKWVLHGPVNNIPALVQVMARHRSGDKPLSEPKIVIFKIVIFRLNLHSNNLNSLSKIAFKWMSQNTADDKHDGVIKWKHFPRYWPFMRGIHRSPVNSPHEGQWRGALMFSLICVWINGWINNRQAGDLRRYLAHYDVTNESTWIEAMVWCYPITIHYLVPCWRRSMSFYGIARPHKATIKTWCRLYSHCWPISFIMPMFLPLIISLNPDFLLNREMIRWLSVIWL